MLQACSYEVTGKHWFCNNKWPERSGFLLLLRINLPSLFIHDIITVNVSIRSEMSDTGNYGQELHFFVLQEWRCNAFDISNIKIEWKQMFFFLIDITVMWDVCKKRWFIMITHMWSRVNTFKYLWKRVEGCYVMMTLWRKEIFYLMMHSTHFIYGYMALDMVKDHSDSEKRNQLLPHGLLFSN